MRDIRRTDEARDRYNALPERTRTALPLDIVIEETGHP